MAQRFFICLILADAFLGLAMATQTTQQPISNPPAPAPSPSISRRLGKHKENILKSFHETVSSPSEAPQATRETTGSSYETAAVSSNELESVRVHVSQEGIHMKKNHHSVDKSVAGGGVILGGLATTFLVAIFCYIRATRRHKTDAQTQTTV